MASDIYDSYEHLADSTEATTLRQVELMSMYEQTLEPLTMLEFGILGVMNEFRNNESIDE